MNLHCQNNVWTAAALSVALVFASCSNNTASRTDYVQDVVYALTDTTFEGRETGTEGEQMASRWLDIQFTSLGLQAKGDSGSRQTFRYKPHPPLQVHGTGDSTQLGMALVTEIVGENVIYALEAGSKPFWGIIGAHYDHLGYGDENSLFRGEPTIHYGADDNASGVAGMLELARRFRENQAGHPLLFAAFSGEEKGLWGSNKYCESPTINLDSARYMINFDMVGRLRGDTLAVYGTGTSPGWMTLLEECNEDSLILVPSESGVGPSDHTSFYLEDIPVLHFFTGQHPDYHKPSDTPDKINYDGIVRIVDFVERVVRRLNEEPDWIFTATKDQDEESTPRFNVTLGVIPDYLYDGKGMRIDGVSEGRPAQLAGLQRGDVVLAIDTVDVVDMMSYMGALSLFQEGQTSEVVILRGTQELSFSVLWD